MRTCFELDGGRCSRIALVQQGRDRFRVRYGLQVKSNLDYAQAAEELGACILHRLACDGRLDNREACDDPTCWCNT